jgi:uridine kinase
MSETHIYNIRGTNGSGKTTFVRTILDQMGGGPIGWRGPKRNKVEAYAGEYKGKSIVILGSYEAACGGMDTVTDINDRVDMIHTYANKGYDIMLLEGLMMSHAIGRMGEAMKLYKHTLAFLDTPLEKCIDRVIARRHEKGNYEEFDPKNVVKDHHAVSLCYKNCIKQGLPAIMIDHNATMEAFFNACY